LSEILSGPYFTSCISLTTSALRRATTHTDLILRAEELKIPYTVIHNASIMNAIGATGLALYNFGQTISIPFFTETWRPDSWLDRILENWKLGLHTLCLLDIKVKEQSEENMARSVAF
jgi:diphthine synthase